MKIKPITTPEQLLAVAEAARADDHSHLVGATHLAEKDGEIVGCFTIGPCVHWWMHSEKCKARDSFHTMLSIETLLRNQGYQRAYILCAQSSPYFDHMDKFGCTDVGTSHIFMKEL